METVKKIKSLVVVYFVLMVFLLLCIAATPLLIRHGLTISGHLIMEEEFLETALIVAIFLFSYLILSAYRKALDAYRNAVARAGEDKSRLMSRLTDAFSYIGSVNVGINEIQSIVSGCDHYPQTRKEFKQFLRGLTAKVMTITGAPWIVVRIIDPSTRRTVKEYTARGRGSVAPSTTIGNRAIIEGRLNKEFRTLVVRQKNPDLLTVCILPAIALSEDQLVVATAAAKEIEMAFMLYRAGGCNGHPTKSTVQTEKGTP
ncbi:MAG: hypothetical protein P8X96_10420 [Desulfobacteraceae bacterium]